MTVDSGIFMVSVVVAVFGAIMMIAQRNPVASVLYLILSLVAQAVLYVQLSALFVAAILIMVYAGAILVLFLFVIMLLNLRTSEEETGPRPPALSRLSKLLVGTLLVVELGFIIYGVGFPNAGLTGIMGAAPADTFGSVEEVATLLFTTYLFPFELTSILLLVAIVGAVVMAKRESGDDDHQLFHETGDPLEEAQQSTGEEMRG